MKKCMGVIAAAAGLLLLAGCAGTKPVEREAGRTYELVVLHTNDHHGTTLSKNGIAGLAERAAFVKSVRSGGQNVLVLDAGDINTGSALSNMFSAEPDIKAYNMIGYDAVAFGNHEFDGSLEKLTKQMQLADFDWISANVKKANGKTLGKPYVVKDFDGFRVGILGLTTLRTLVIASPDKSLVFEDEIAAAKKAAADLINKEKADILIAVGHLGSVEETQGQNTSVKLAEAVPEIDLIIDGHSHTKFDEPLYVNGTPIVSANEWGKVMGKGTFAIADGDVVSFSWQPAEITAAAFPPDAEVAAMLQPYVDEASAGIKKVVMTAAEKFEFGNRLSRYREIALGDLTCDATVAYLASTGVSVDFAFHNGGNIRAELSAGAVTKEHIMTVLPFENYVYVLTLNGSDVIELFDFIGSIKQGSGAFAQMSEEVRYTISYNKNGSGTVSGVTISGSEIDPSKTYRIATNDYLAGGGDGYTVLTRSIDTYNTSMLLSDVVSDYVQTLPQPVTPATDGRIIIAGGVEP